MVPSYQPEAAYRIFMRALRGKDIATGEINLNEYASSNQDQYATTGPSDTWWMKNDVLPQMPHSCYILDPQSRCSEEEIEWIKDGSAIVKDWILIGRHSNKTEVEQSPLAGGDQVPLKEDL